jgi:hypothetical protein
MNSSLRRKNGWTGLGVSDSLVDCNSAPPFKNEPHEFLQRSRPGRSKITALAQQLEMEHWDPEEAEATCEAAEACKHVEEE